MVVETVGGVDASNVTDAVGIAGTIVAEINAAEINAVMDDSVGAYIQIIGRTPLLTARQEHALAVAVRTGRQASARARRHLASCLRHELLEQSRHGHTRGPVEVLAAAAAEWLEQDEAGAALRIRALVAACAQQPPADSAVTATEALEALVAGLTRGDDAAVAALLDITTRAGLAHDEAGRVMARPAARRRRC